MTNWDRELQWAVGFELTPAVRTADTFFFDLPQDDFHFSCPPHLFLGGRILAPKYLACQKVSCELRSWLSLVEVGGSHKNYFCAWDLSRTGTTKRIGATTTPRCRPLDTFGKPQWRTLAYVFISLATVTRWATVTRRRQPTEVHLGGIRTPRHRNSER
jgi:hypothetical protein